MKSYLRIIISVALCLCVCVVCSCSSTSTDPADMYKDKTEVQIFRDGQKAMLKKDYDDAISHFEALDARYPFGKYSRQTALDLIYSYHKNGDDVSALAAADRYIRTYPRDKDTDYAYYMRGLIKFGQNRGFFEKYFNIDYADRDLSTLKGAYADFALLKRYHPNSKYVPDAKQHMVFIRNAIARHVYKIAKFYYDRNAYAASANRANEVVQNYQEAPSVPKALALMVKSYRKLGLTENANDTLKVLRLNFPESKELKSVDFA
jgi:outer membrane protein assembly factor BamD